MNAQPLEPSLSIDVHRHWITVSCDPRRWKSLAVRGQSAVTKFPATVTALNRLEFQANCSDTSVAVPSGPLVLTGRDGATGSDWIAIVEFCSDGRGGCIASGTVTRLAESNGLPVETV